VTRRHPGRSSLVVLVPLLALAAACGSDNGDDPGDTKASVTGTCSYHDDGTSPAKPVDAPPADPPASNPKSVTISTSAGDIPVTLEPEQAPCAVNSLLSLADQGYFDNTQCHRLTTQGYYVLQCGDPSGTGSGGPGYTFADELVDNDPRLQPCGEEQGQKYCTYNAGTVAMANAGKDTNGSQFFLVYGNSKFPPNYTVLGHMDAAGLKVVTAIAKLGIGTPNGMGPGDGAPKEPVTITGVK
jgi:peptidyl-prolyl cis-trans isomerase B (cyclophilin B)